MTLSCFRVLTTLRETQAQRHHTKFPFLQPTHGKRLSFCCFKISVLTPFGNISLIGVFGEQMNDSSAKGKQKKSANAKSATSLQITEPVESKPDGEVISELQKFCMLNPVCKLV